MVVALKSAGIAYWPIPKCACSSVKAMIAQIDPEHDDAANDTGELLDGRQLHNRYQTRRFRRHRYLENRDAFKFIVVRDPIKRLMSVYTNRVIEHGDLINSPRLRRTKALSQTPDPDEFFQNLAEYKKQCTFIYHHAVQMATFVGYKLRRFDRVYRTSELGELASDLSGLTGRTVKVAHSNPSRMKLDFHDLKPATREALIPFLRKEYEFLSGYYDNPFPPAEEGALPFSAPRHLTTA